MNLFVIFALSFDVLSDCFFIPMSSHGIHVVTACPDMSTPEHLFDLWMQPEQMLGGDAFCRFDDLGR